MKEGESDFNNLICDMVKNQFFQPFYTNRIIYVKTLPEEVSKRVDLAILKFWCSVIDFYGGIYYIGVNNKTQQGFRNNFKLASAESFSLFIHDHFPYPESEYGDFIYSVFRSGIVHQLSPKRSHIHWEYGGRSDLIWVDIDIGIEDPIQNKEAHINLKRFQGLTYEAYYKFYDFIEHKVNPKFCANVINHLMGVPDLLGDGKSLDAAFNKLLAKGFNISHSEPSEP